MQHKPLPPLTRQAAQAIVARVAAAYPVTQAILFGSRARGTERPDSDADVAVLLKGHGHFLRTKMAMADMAYDVLLDTGIRIQPLPIWLTGPAAAAVGPAGADQPPAGSNGKPQKARHLTEPSGNL